MPGPPDQKMPCEQSHHWIKLENFSFTRENRQVMALLPLNLLVTSKEAHNAVSFACGANRRVTIRTWRQ